MNPDLPLTLVAKFDAESREAFFAAAMDAVSRRDSAGLTRHIVANLLRTPVLGELVRRRGINLAAVFDALGADPQGSSFFEAFHNLVQGEEAELDEGAFEAALRQPPLNRMPPSGTFATVAMPPTLAASWRVLAVQFQNALDESITPAQLLAAILKDEHDLREQLETLGLNIRDLSS